MTGWGKAGQVNGIVNGKVQRQSLVSTLSLDRIEGLRIGYFRGSAAALGAIDVEARRNLGPASTATAYADLGKQISRDIEVPEIGEALAVIGAVGGFCDRPVT